MNTLHIALLGYGKMGKEIEKIALERNHHIVTRIDREEDWESQADNLIQTDVAIDFSTPGSAVENIRHCFEKNIPIVVGTTGWDSHKEEIIALCQSHNQALFTSSNFSIGVYLFMATARYLSEKMGMQGNYAARIDETHHIHKLDKPSGTAITLAETVIQSIPAYQQWETCENAQASMPPTLPIRSFREGEVVGRHQLIFESDIDQIEITHNAKSRKGFALGAVKAAEWLIGRKGYFQMKDMMGF